MVDKAKEEKYPGAGHEQSCQTLMGDSVRQGQRRDPWV